MVPCCSPRSLSRLAVWLPGCLAAWPPGCVAAWLPRMPASQGCPLPGCLPQLAGGLSTLNRWSSGQSATKCLVDLQPGARLICSFGIRLSFIPLLSSCALPIIKLSRGPPSCRGRLAPFKFFASSSGGWQLYFGFCSASAACALPLACNHKPSLRIEPSADVVTCIW